MPPRCHVKQLNNEGNYTSLINNIFSNTNDESFSSTISYDISDHLPIYHCAYNDSNDNNNNNIFNKYSCNGLKESHKDKHK